MLFAMSSDLLLKLLAIPDPAAARRFLTAAKSCSKAQRKELAKLAGLEAAWVDCDQAMPCNVEDLSGSIISELYEPFWFFRRCLSTTQPSHSRASHSCSSGADTRPEALFEQGLTTRPLEKHRGYWTSKAGLAPSSWQLPARAETFDAVCHFVQAASGTGVHVAGGSILTCAHVIDHRDDAELEAEGELPVRLGRRKLVMFGSGRTFLAECVAVDESTDGMHDVAVLALRTELAVSLLPPQADMDSTSGAAALPPAACVAATPVEAGGRLFCVGNPSSIDLESLGEDATVEFAPPTWHTSVGHCLGYQSAEVHAAREAQAARGRAPTRGERKLVDEAVSVRADLGGKRLQSNSELSLFTSPPFC